jgi:hypothetical protein
MFDRLAELRLDVESYDFVRLTGGERSTTLLRLHGGGLSGLGEDIMPSDADHDAFEAMSDLPLAGSWTITAVARVSEFDEVRASTTMQVR